MASGPTHMAIPAPWASLPEELWKRVRLSRKVTINSDAVVPGGRRIKSGLEKSTEVAVVKVRCHT